MKRKMSFGKMEKLNDRRKGETFEKWYPSGTDILSIRLPSLDEPPFMTMVSLSAPDRLLRRFKDLDFGAGG